MQVSVLTAQLANVGLFLIDDEAKLFSFPAHSRHGFVQFFFRAGDHVEIIRISGGFFDSAHDLGIVVYRHRQENARVRRDLIADVHAFSQHLLPGQGGCRNAKVERGTYFLPAHSLNFFIGES